MRRVLFVVAAGLVGLLLGLGLSLVADEVAGRHISQPVPIGLHPEATTSPASDASSSHGEGDRERSTPSVSGGSSPASSAAPSNDSDDTGGSAADSGSSHDDD